jgi:hypothetical protein
MFQLKNSLVLNSVASFPFIFPVSKATKLSSKLQFPCDLTQSVQPLVEARAETVWFLHTGVVSKLHYLWAKTAFTLLFEGQTIQNKVITSIIYVNLYDIIPTSHQFVSHHEV